MSEVASIYSRWQNLEALKAEVAEDLKELFAEAKGNGHDTKALRAAFRLASQAENETDGDREHAAKVELYLAEISTPRAGRADARVEPQGFAADLAATKPVHNVEAPSQRATAGENLGVTARRDEQPYSEMDGDAIAAVKGQARPASVVDAEPSPSCTILRESKPLRPFCQNRESCSSGTRDHCWSCKKVAASSEVAA